MVQVSLPFNRVLRTQALYTAIFVVVVNLGVVHTLDVRRARVVAAFPISLSISASRERPKICELANNINRARSR